ncbi:MAG: HEAT repeat domain-containing protein [Planctomycetes bacterium]|nr:HEAT repeat domain-containing protein [Planctomycetota bacterium]
MHLQLVTPFPAIAMRHLVLFVLLLSFAGGCSKKKPEPVPEPEPETKADPVETLAKDRAYWFKGLNSKDAKVRQDAADELTAWVATDPDTVDTLIGLLKDRTTTGAGKTLPNRFNSTRELAVDILNRGGPKGQAALKDRGFAILREGLNDPDAAIREHTLHTIGTLGSMAKPLSPDVLKLCTNPDPNIHRVAFDTLRAIGGAEPLDITNMLTSKRHDIVRLAAEQLSSFSKVPEEAVPNLIVGLKDKSPAIRTPCAAALATIGPKAAPALDALIKAINETYPKEVDPMANAPELSADAAYWSALTAIGEPAVAPTAGLLKHTNPYVRTYAAQTLGEIGEPSKVAADKLKAALKDDYGNVAIEAACTLCRIGEGKDDAVELVKKAMDAPNTIAQTAIEAIPRMGDAGKSLIPVALEKLKSENPYARYAAVGVVGTLEPAEAAKYVPELAKLATDNGAGAGTPELERRGAREIRLRVAAVLIKLGPLASPAAEAIGKAIPNEGDSGLRDQFIEVLVSMGEGAKPAFPALLTIAADPSTQPDRRAHLFDVLTIIAPGSKEVSGILLKAAGETGSPVRFVAITKMAKFDPMPPEVLAKLVEMATTDRATNVRAAALRALASAGVRAKPVKADIEKIASGSIPEFALTAKVTLAGIDGNLASVAGDVRTALTDKNAQVRLAAVDALFLIGPEASDVPTLQKLLMERGDSTKEAAAKCVGRLGPAGKDAVPQLVRLLDDRDGNVRIAAANALGDIGPAAKDAVEKLKAMRGMGKRNESSDPTAGPAAGVALTKIVVKEKK